MLVQMYVILRSGQYARLRETDNEMAQSLLPDPPSASLY